MMGALFQSASAAPMDRDEVIQKLQWELLQKAGCHFFNCLNYFKLKCCQHLSTTLVFLTYSNVQHRKGNDLSVKSLAAQASV